MTEDCKNRIGCNVTTCNYNDKGCYCVADHIKVANENAEKKAETFCSTFSLKDSCKDGRCF